MNRLQIQLPEPLYKRLKLIAKNLDYSMAELMRRGVEQIIFAYPQFSDTPDQGKPWRLPPTSKMGMKKIAPRELRSLAYEKKR